MFTCPSEELLTRLGSDALGAETYAGLEDHIGSCEACQAFLQRLVDQGPGIAISAAAPMPAPGTVPDIPDLAIERELGRGSMGVVYLARQESLQRLVALKILRVGPDTGSRERGRWRREARAASRAPHPNAVQVFQVGESGAWLYLVFEYVTGGTLKDRLKEPLPPTNAAMLVEDIARAVGHFHRAGVLHLDLKPSNILLDGDSNAGWERVTPKVADFGIARLRNEPGATTVSLVRPLGTPDYMAPEQASGDQGSLGPACDIYALGAILYHALTGRPPFQAASVMETLDQVRGQEPVPPRRLNPCVSRDLDTICLKCIQKDPRRRYESAEALADDLRRWREGHPITARRAAPFEHAWRWCRRRPAIASLAAALILTLAASFVGLVVLLNRAQAERAEAVSARQRSEENENAAVATIKQLALLASTAITDFHPLLGARSLDSVQILRDQIGELKKHPGFDRKLVGRLSSLECVVAQKFTAKGRRKEARALLADAIAMVEDSRKCDPGDQFLLQQHISSLGNLGSLDFAEYEVDRGVDCLEKAAAQVRAFGTRRLRVDAYTSLWTIRRDFADQLAVRGDSERFRLVLESDRRMFDSLDTLDLHDPTIVSCKARTLADLGETSRAEELLRSTFEDGSVDLASRQRLGQALAGLTADRSLLLKPDATSSSSGPMDARPGMWADELLAEVHARCKKFGIDRSVTPEALAGIARSAGFIAAQQRGLGRLADARRTGERLSALADRLVTLYPEQPASYMVLSNAFVHQAKAAWQAHENETAHRLERQALDAARHAFDLDPRNEDARRLVGDREYRLARLRGR